MARSCWTESPSTCIRKLVVAHGGEWNLTFPYDSMPAFDKAYKNGADAVKGGIFQIYCVYNI